MQEEKKKRVDSNSDEQDIEISGVSEQGTKYLNLALLIIILILLVYVMYSVFELKDAIKAIDKTKCTNTEKVIENNWNRVTSEGGDVNVMFNATFIPGQDCYVICTNNTNKCNKTCKPVEENCINNSDCCSDCCKYNNNGAFICKPESECKPCVPYGEVCINDSDCCDRDNFKCVNGRCGIPPNVPTVPISPPLCKSENSSCANSSECCPSLSCISGICKRPCTVAGASCASTGDCCSGCCKVTGVGVRTCTNSAVCCGNQSEFCITSSDCCQGYSCMGDTCQPNL
jgi:hypothetical protein